MILVFARVQLQGNRFAEVDTRLRRFGTRHLLERMHGVKSRESDQRCALAGLDGAVSV